MCFPSSRRRICIRFSHPSTALSSHFNLVRSFDSPSSPSASIAAKGVALLPSACLRRVPRHSRCHQSILHRLSQKSCCFGLSALPHAARSRSPVKRFHRWFSVCRFACSSFCRIVPSSCTTGASLKRKDEREKGKVTKQKQIAWSRCFADLPAQETSLLVLFSRT